MSNSSNAHLVGILACAGLLLGGCGGSDEKSAQDRDAHAMHDGGHEGSNEAMESADDITVGLTKEGDQGVVAAELLEASPTPPDDDILNVWKVRLTDMSTDEPAADVGVVKLRLWMPNHGHGTQTKPITTPMEEAGVWEWSQMKLRMGGLWTIDAHLCEEGVERSECDDSSEGWIDTVQFRVWIVEE